MTIRGKSAYDLLNRLAPFFDGNRDLGSLVSGTNEGAAERVRQLVARLAASGFVRDAGTDRPHGLTEEDLEAYAGELAFIEYFRDSPAHRYECFRDTPVLCVGHGLTFDGLVRAFLHLGSRRIVTVRTGEAPPMPEEALRRARERDPRVEVVEEAELTPGLVAAAGSVVAFADDFDRVAAERLDAMCAEHGTTVLHGAITGDEAWLGPLASPTSTTRGPDLWARVGPPCAGRSVYLAAPVARIVASQLAFEVFKLLSGAPADDFEDRGVRIDLATLMTEEVPLRDPEPAPAPEGPWRGSMICAAELERLNTALASLVDARLGPITSVEEGPYTQIPLHVCGATTRTAGVLGAGLDVRSARVSAVLAAVELAALDAMPGGPVAAVDLANGAACRADLAAARAAGTVTVASGATWPEAMKRALARMVHRVRRGARPEGRVLSTAETCAAIEADPDAARLWDVLLAAGRAAPVRIIELPGLVLARIGGSGDGRCGMGAANDLVGAVTDALFDAVLGMHERLNGVEVRTPDLPGPGPGGAVATTVREVPHWLFPGSGLVAVTLAPHEESARTGRICVAVLPGEGR
ncbi:hypothetical protein GWI34_00920 [Actinomadura sp. DSM 109109]|nr:hypothetical protein [Actinomadura lepetitiana]